MEFVAIDFETANSSLSSICQVGIVVFEAGRPVHTWDQLVDPETEFDWVNIGIHGIQPEDVAGQPNWLGVHDRIVEMISGRTVVTHTPFDRTAIGQTCSRYGLPAPECAWLDSARVARRTWREIARKGYGLGNVTEMLGISFRHHNAAEDARAAGEILLQAMAKEGYSLEQVFERSWQPLTPPSRYQSAGIGSISRAGNIDGPLFGEFVAFTGALSITRSEAADLVAEAGCTVNPGVTKKTTLLVVGDQDIRVLAGHQRSSKHRKAEKLIANGQPIRVLAESDLRTLLASVVPVSTHKAPIDQAPMVQAPEVPAPIIQAPENHRRKGGVAALWRTLSTWRS